MSSFLNKFIFWGLLILAFLTPFFFLPLTSEFFEFPKQVLVLAVVLILLLTAGLRMILAKNVTFVRTPLDLPLSLLAAVLLASTIFAQNKYEAFVAVVPLLLLIALYFLIVNFLSEGKQTHYLTGSLIFSGAILSLLTFVLFLLPASRFPLNFSIFNFQFSISNASWSPTGSLLIQALVLAALLPLAVGFLIKFFQENKNLFTIYYLLLTIFILTGLGLSVYQLATTAKPTLLSQTAGWSIATGTMGSSFKEALLGSGPGSFLTDFTRFRPVAYNLGNLWNLRFATSSNFYFQILSEVGILGLASLLLLIFKFLNLYFRHPSASSPKILGAGVLLLFILGLFFPPNFLLLFVQFSLLGLFVASSPSPEVYPVTFTVVAFREGLFRTERLQPSSPTVTQSPVLPWSIFGPLFVVAVVLFYFAGRVFWAEVWFQKSLIFASQNQGIPTYSAQIKAIGLNPWKAEYRIAYSQTNLALGSSLAQKTELTDQEKQMIPQLVQQAIREARNATVLAPQKVTPWENLAQIYRNLINFAQGADQWTIAAYQQAVTLDPVNPLLRLNLGGVFYAQKKFSEAQNLFSQAVNLKPDWGNAHYNLGHALQEQGKLAEAVFEYKLAQNLVRPETEDYQKVTREIQALEKKLPSTKEATPSAQKELQLAAPPTPQVSPSLRLSTQSGELATGSGR